MQTKAYYKYAQDVIEGNVVCGKYIKLAAERFFDFMENDRYEFREEKVEYVIKFFSILRHFTGRHAGKPFALQPWQQFVIASIYGFSKIRIYRDFQKKRENGIRCGVMSFPSYSRRGNGC